VPPRRAQSRTPERGRARELQVDSRRDGALDGRCAVLGIGEGETATDLLTDLVVVTEYSCCFVTLDLDE
jgi:hypothetical protein